MKPKRCHFWMATHWNQNGGRGSVCVCVCEWCSWPGEMAKKVRAVVWDGLGRVPLKVSLGIFLFPGCFQGSSCVEQVVCLFLWMFIGRKGRGSEGLVEGRTSKGLKGCRIKCWAVKHFSHEYVWLRVHLLLFDECREFSYSSKTIISILCRKKRD